MSALFTALLESESKESLAEMVCELRATNARLSEALGKMHQAFNAKKPLSRQESDALEAMCRSLTTPSTGKG